MVGVGMATQHFGLISPHKCCSVTLPASSASAPCLLDPLTVGCHNDIQQPREAWLSSDWARWRAGGTTELSHTGVPARMIRRQVAIGKEEASAGAGVARKSLNPSLQISRVWPQMLPKLERKKLVGKSGRRK